MGKKNILWSAVLVILVAFTITVISLTADISLNDFIEYVKKADYRWIAMAFVFLLIYISCEAFAILVLAKAFGYKRKFSEGVLYSTSDIYFSAITPSATGGQPASAMFMVRSRIPTAATTVILLINLSLFTTSLISLGAVCFLFKFKMFLGFGAISKSLIVFGFGFQFVLTAVFILLVYKEKIVMKCADVIFGLLTSLHIMKKSDDKKAKLLRLEKQYKECADMVLKHKKHLLVAFGFNLLQRASLAMISVCVAFAVGVPVKRFTDVFSAQMFVMLGSNSVPIPGAVGATDYLFIDGYRDIAGDTVIMELLSRGISFYICILLCALITLVLAIVQKTKNSSDL